MEGSQMKMREALVAIKDTINELRERNPNVVDCVRDAIGMIENWTDAALSEPPRNCDMFGGNLKRLNTAWFDWTGTPSGQNPDGTVRMTFGEWLLATAEKGADA